jgi:hypothetical protein
VSCSPDGKVRFAKDRGGEGMCEAGNISGVVGSGDGTSRGESKKLGGEEEWVNLALQF